MLALIAGYSLGQIAVAIVIIAAVVAIVFVALRQFNVTIPAWVVQVFWVIVVAVVCIAAIRFLLTL